MHIVRDTLDDILREVYGTLLEKSDKIETTRGATSELVGTHIELLNPRARLSRTETRGKAFSCLGELLWFLSGNNQLDFIQHYVPKYVDESEDGQTVYGGYGPRLFSTNGINQVDQVISLLKVNKLSRRAVIQLFKAEDNINAHHAHLRHREVPCTTHFQFLVRDNRLHMLTYMRSNDAYLGLPHDVFCFTMLQEIVACSISVELGVYRHFVGSLHLYSDHEADATDFMTEMFSGRTEMPPMPHGDPWPSIDTVLEAEGRIRNKSQIDVDQLGLDSYWKDLLRLLQIYAASDTTVIDAIHSKMSCNCYRPYIENRRERSGTKHVAYP